MNTKEQKPKKIRPLNTKLLPVAAILLVVLALLFMATPLLRTTRGFQRNSNFVTQNNGQGVTRNNNPGGGSTPPSSFDRSGSNLPNRQFTIRSGTFLGGVTGAIVFFGALIVSLAAALGMFNSRRWGQVLGIIMAVFYALVGLVSLLPVLLFFSAALRNPLNLILGIIHLLLAVAVIVFASIPAKKSPATVPADPPPSARA